MEIYHSIELEKMLEKKENTANAIMADILDIDFEGIFVLVTITFWCCFSFGDISFSKHRPSGPMFSISRNVLLCVCVSVCSLLRFRLNIFLPPLRKVGCLNVLEIRNPWGKVLERSGLGLELFCSKIV